MAKEPEMLKTGTTTVGIVCKDGVVMGADKRSSAGYLIANKRQTKIVKVDDYIAVTQAGLVSDAQLLSKLIKAELRLKNMRTERKATVKEAANLLAGMLYSNIRRPSMFMSVVGFLLGGFDKYGPQLYNLGIDGSITQMYDYSTDGSGSVYAMGVLETLYKPEMTMEEGIELVVKAINAALQRDMATGNGIDVITIDKNGYKHQFTKTYEEKIEM